MDKIIIKDLEVETRIGVTTAEQAQPQKLLVTVDMELDLSTAGRTDSQSTTTPYDHVAEMIRKVVVARPRKLLEAVADEIADAILSHRLALTVTVEVKKFSIPGSQYVSVVITRSQ